MCALHLLSVPFLQASSHSSYKSSPLPKLNPLDGDDIRRNSPANTPVGHNQSSLSIKQELLEVGAHAGLPPDLMPVSTSVHLVVFGFVGRHICRCGCAETDISIIVIR